VARSNYETLGLREGAGEREVQQAFRRLALIYHSDRGGDEERFKEIKRAYDGLRAGRARESPPGPGTDYSAESARINTELAREVAREMRDAEAWAASLVASGSTGTRLFGSASLGEIELERRPNGVLSIKGNVAAGTLRYDGPITVSGAITSPTRGAEPTEITAAVGDFRVPDAVSNRYRIENGARITAENGNIAAGNVFGKKRRVDDPDGRVGVYTVVEHRTRLSAPNGTVSVGTAAGAVDLCALRVEAHTLREDVRVDARDIAIGGPTMTHDVSLRVRAGGTLRFVEAGSVLGLSDDATVSAEGGAEISLRELKVKRIRDVDPSHGGDGTLVGAGRAITHAELLAVSERASLGSRLRGLARRRR